MSLIRKVLAMFAVIHYAGTDIFGQNINTKRDSIDSYGNKDKLDKMCKEILTKVSPMCKCLAAEIEGKFQVKRNTETESTTARIQVQNAKNRIIETYVSRNYSSLYRNARSSNQKDFSSNFADIMEVNTNDWQQPEKAAHTRISRQSQNLTTIEAEQISSTEEVIDMKLECGCRGDQV